MAVWLPSLTQTSKKNHKSEFFPPIKGLPQSRSFRPQFWGYLQFVFRNTWHRKCIFKKKKKRKEKPNHRASEQLATLAIRTVSDPKRLPTSSCSFRLLAVLPLPSPSSVIQIQRRDKPWHSRKDFRQDCECVFWRSQR